MTSQIKRFSYCPSCGAPKPDWDGTKRYSCQICDWEYFQNTASAVIGLLEYEKKILFTVRNQDPGKGLLDLPGGFTDPGESAEEALRREIMEELGIQLGELEYLGSSPNIYPYKGTEYTSCDCIFLTNISEMPQSFEVEEISNILLLHPEDVPISEIPFASVRNAIALYIEKKRRPI